MNTSVKTMLLAVAAVGLSGCAVYPAPGYESYGMGPVYGAPPPVYIYGGAVYRYDNHPQVEPRIHPGPRPRPRDWDRDRDGVPNRADRDRDGDGVPNWADRQPDDPRRH